jgi:hypothetical protein
MEEYAGEHYVCGYLDFDNEKVRYNEYAGELNY